MLLEEDDRLRRRRYGPLENGRSGRKRTGRRVGEQGVSAGRQPQGSVGLDVVNDLTERAMRSGQRVGLVIGCLAGTQQRVAGYGRLRTDAQDTPDGGTIFEIGSVTKLFTGLLLADLAEGGLVGLDDPLASYLPAAVRVPTFGATSSPLPTWPAMPVGCGATPRARCGGGWVTGTTPTRGCRSRACTRALPGPTCDGGRASASNTPTWVPAC
jgi:CubicO group peptidase (beta-lactamase class C family)